MSLIHEVGQKVILNWNRPQGLNHKLEKDGKKDDESSVKSGHYAGYEQ
jgi:hypothetical protein